MPLAATRDRFWLLRNLLGSRATRREFVGGDHADVETPPQLRIENGAQRPAVRMPSGPPVTLIWPVTFRLLPSKLTMASALSTMLCASKVLPSRLQATPWGHCPILTSATFVSVVPFTVKTTSKP